MIGLPDIRPHGREIGREKNRAAAPLAGLPPACAGDLAFRLFCAPARSERRHPNQRQLAERARFHLRPAVWRRIPTPAGEVQTYLYEPDEARSDGYVLIVHGWTSEASFMTAMAEAVRRAGHRVVLFDLPAHGLSEGRSTNLMDCARATACVAQAFGPLNAVITHSFGGMTALVAAEGPPRMPYALQAPRIVLIASPNRLTDVTRDFGRHWHLGNAAQRAFEQRLERIGQRPMAQFTTANLLRASGCEALIVHARDDAEVPFRCAKDIAADVRNATVLAFDGLGHRNILFAPPALRAIVHGLAAPSAHALKPRV
jgi:pimeloyl-ACP methyl ester carboxylesterase